MKPLTREQIDMLDAFDGVWIANPEDHQSGAYMQIADINHESFEAYGFGWVAYKNKECVCTHPEGCCFPECENQQYCIDNYEDLLKMAGGGK